MVDRTFIITHAHARAALTITGKSLKDALEKEGLDPTIWKLLGAVPGLEIEPDGDSHGDARPEDN